mgnify:CR=1 FL=1
MIDVAKLRGMLFTLGNVTVRDDIKYSFPNPSPDPVVANRSQELYDALSRNLNIIAWACGRYGQHGYSPELGRKYAKRIETILKKESDLEYEYAIQMAGHPIIHHSKPYFIIVDYIPYFDLSILDKVHFPCIRKEYERDQDFLYQEATGIITYTPVQRYMLINWLNVDPCKVTSICAGINGLVPREYHKKNTKHLLWVGADYERKGGDDVIKAFKMLHQRDPEYKLTMVGIDREFPQIPGVTVYPFLHGDDLSKLDELYRKASVFVMPSYKENLGLVYLEAMARKTPVVVTTRGGFAEVIRRTGAGEIVVPGNVEAICEAIEKIHRPEEFERYAERAYHFVANNATWDIVTKNIVDAINRWLSGAPVADDYIDYSMNEKYEKYKSVIKQGVR